MAKSKSAVSGSTSGIGGNAQGPSTQTGVGGGTKIRKPSELDR